MEALFVLIVLAIVAAPVVVIVLLVRSTDSIRALRDDLEGVNGRVRDLEADVAKLRDARIAGELHPAQREAQATVQTSRAAPVEGVTTPAAAPAPPVVATHAPAPPIAAFTAAPAPSVTTQPPAIRPSPAVQPRPQQPPEQPKPYFPVAPAPILRKQVPEIDAETAPATGIFSLEERLGTNWLNKLGIAILVLGVASFLAYKLQTWGPAGKVLCGYSVSLVLLAGGVWLERKDTYRIFARAGIGGGWALAFFTTFALYHIPAARVLSSIAADLVLMLLVAVGMVAHSLRYRSQAITGLAFLLGFATVLTSHLEAASGTVVFSLTASAVLALALVVVTTLRHWAWLELAGLIAVYLTHWVWLSNVLPANHAAFAEFWPSTALILLYWLIFRLAYVFRTPLNQKEESVSSLTAVLNSTGVLGLLKIQAAHPEWAFWALAALGVFEMAFAFRVRSRRRQAFIVLSTIATVLLVAAVPFKFHGVSWPVLWLVEAQVLAVCGLRLGEPVFRRLGLLAGVITGGVLAFHDVLPLLLLRLSHPDPGRHTTLTVALALAAILYWVHAEVYPRRWPQIAEDEREAFALRITTWLAVAAAATALWVALPDLWLPIGWLGLVLALGFVARRFAAFRVGLEADALSLAAGAVLIFHHIAPLAAFRLDYPDPSHHPAETAILCIAALCYWVYAEVYPRALPSLDLDWAEWTRFILATTGSLAVAMSAATLWVVLPAPWVVVGWLTLVLLLGIVADRLKQHIAALQADLLTLIAVLGFFAWNSTSQGWWDYKLPLIATVALLYAGMRRKTPAVGNRNYMAPAYSWVAAAFLVVMAIGFFTGPWIGPALAAFSLALFEIGRFVRRGFLRWQGYALAAIAFVFYLGEDLFNALSAFDGTFHPKSFTLVGSLLVDVLILAALGYWLLERTLNRERCTAREHVAGLVADALGTFSIALWLGVRFPAYVPGGEFWLASLWAGMATVLLALAWLMRRRAFLVQALALVVAVLARGSFMDLFADAPTGFWHGPLFHLGVAALILLAALPFAFRLRNPDRFGPATIYIPADLTHVLYSPHQVFFFAPFTLMVVALAVKLNSGHITIAWSLLGLAVFLFALAVGERSYRLAGLGLLLVCVVKILLMDVWKLPLSERYTTLIVLGLALLAVSFLYTRFGAVIRKFL